MSIEIDCQGFPKFAKICKQNNVDRRFFRKHRYEMCPLHDEHLETRRSSLTEPYCRKKGFLPPTLRRDLEGWITLAHSFPRGLPMQVIYFSKFWRRGSRSRIVCLAVFARGPLFNSFRREYPRKPCKDAYPFLLCVAQ